MELRQTLGFTSLLLEIIRTMDPRLRGDDSTTQELLTVSFANQIQRSISVRVCVDQLLPLGLNLKIEYA